MLGPSCCDRFATRGETRRAGCQEYRRATFVVGEVKEVKSSVFRHCFFALPSAFHSTFLPNSTFVSNSNTSLSLSSLSNNHRILTTTTLILLLIIILFPIIPHIDLFLLMRLKLRLRWSRRSTSDGSIDERRGVGGGVGSRE